MTRKGFGIILLLYLALGLTYGLIVPPFENFDEIEHFGVVRYVAERGRLPAHGIPEQETYHYRQEASQPPLYYVLSAGLVRLAGLRADDAAEFVRFNPRVICGFEAPTLYDNRAVLYHNPNREAPPWQNALLMLHVLRAWSTLLQAITVVGAWALARMVFPSRPALAFLAMALVAFNPEFLLVASGVNNDNLVTPMTTIGLCLLAQIWRGGMSVRRAFGLGLVAGLAGLSKTSGWLLLIFAGIITLALLVRAKSQRLQIALTALIIPLVGLSMAGWWFWRNWQLYQDPLALRPALALIGGRGSPIDPLTDAGMMFRSYWGQIFCSFYPAGFYIPYGALMILAFGSLAWGWSKIARADRQGLIFMAGWLLLAVIFWARWNATTPGPIARLIFPVLPAVASMMAVGLNRLEKRRRLISRITIALLALLALWTAAQILPAFFAPPPRYADASTVRPQYPLDATLGQSIRLLGYDVSLHDPNLLDLTLYWQPLAPISQDYFLAIQLISPVDTTMRWNYNSWPGHGNYPTSAWQPGEIIADRYRFRLPQDSWPTQAWDVHINLYSEQGRLPVYIENNLAGDRLIVARLRVPGRQPTCPPEGRLAAPVQFGGAIALTHARVVQGQEETRITLCWQALKAVSTDYTVFVHLYDETGTLISNADNQPMQGAFPTSSWQPGDIILDSHRLPSLAPTDRNAYRIAVGMYNLLDGMRLPAYRSGALLPDAAAIIWPAP